MLRHLGQQSVLAQVIQGQQLFFIKCVAVHPDLQLDSAISRRTIVNFQHSNIVTTYEQLALEPGSLLLVQQFYEEGCLSKLIGEHQLQTHTLMRDIAMGLHYLHCQKRYVHMNISAQNIFLKKGHAVIGGITIYPIISQINGSCQAPELLVGRYGYESDIWSLGILYLEILRGKIFEGQVTQAIVGSEINSLQDPSIKVLIRRMLDPQEQHRPSTRQILRHLNTTSTLSCDITPTSAEIVSKLIKYLQDVWCFRISGCKWEQQCKANLSSIQSESDKGNPKAMFLMGRIYESSEVQAEILEAKRLFHKSVEAGEALAYINLFYYYQEHQQRLEYDYLHKGAKLGDYRCLWTLGRYLGYGFDQHQVNLKEALDIMEDLRTKGYPAAIPDAVWLTTQIEGRTNPTQQLAKILTEGAKFGDRRSIQMFGDYLQSKHSLNLGLKLSMVTHRMEGDTIGDKHQISHSNGWCLMRLGDRLASVKWLKMAEQQGSMLSKQSILKEKMFG